MPMEHGKFLCKKAKVLHLANQPMESKEALSEAEQIAQDTEVKQDSELGKAITEAKDFLSR